MRKGILVATVLALSLALTSAAAAAPVARGAAAHIAKKKKKKKKHHHTTTSGGGATMTVVGFGLNHLYAANGTTVSSAADCSTMVQGNGYPDGPPQNIYLEAYIKATDIPGSSEVQVGEEYPGSDDTVRMASVALQDTLSPPIPWSQAFDPSTLGFGTPPGSQKDIFRGGLFSEDDQDGPSASDFDGDYSYEVSVVVGGQTLTSTADVTVNC